MNDLMYIERPYLQERLQRAVNGTQNLVIHGESGNGKTWLYQRYLKRQRIPYKVVDLSIAASYGLEEAFRNCKETAYGWKPVQKTKKDNIGFNVGIGGQMTDEEQRTFFDPPEFEAVIEELARESQGSKFLVFDNLEQVTHHSDLLELIGQHIIRLDNPRFGLSGVRFLLVGVTSDIPLLLSASGGRSLTLTNRLIELPEVENLAESEASSLLELGFKRLKISLDNPSIILDSAVYLTGGNAQQLHSLGYQIACEAEKNEWIVGLDQYEKALDHWFDESISQISSIVESRFNIKKAKVGRKDQVLFVISSIFEAEFMSKDVEEDIRIKFPKTSGSGRMGVDQILKGLCEGADPILKFDARRMMFRFVDPRYKMAIRSLLTVDDDGSIMKVRDWRAFCR